MDYLSIISVIGLTVLAFKGIADSGKIKHLKEEIESTYNLVHSKYEKVLENVSTFYGNITADTAKKQELEKCQTEIKTLQVKVWDLQNPGKYKIGEKVSAFRQVYLVPNTTEEMTDALIIKIAIDEDSNPFRRYYVLHDGEKSISFYEDQITTKKTSRNRA